jgi:predicted SnoaL-like aldol condensation-catalyzing enzyme
VNRDEALAFIRNYFYELFEKRNLDALDAYLDEDYFDDDVGDAAINHKKEAREYLTKLFREKPTIGVEVVDALARGQVISAFLEWFVTENGVKKVFMKGVANFVLRDGRIIKRHTFIYYNERVNQA